MMPKFYKPIQCKDGFQMSVQASHRHYCDPKAPAGPYLAVEVGGITSQEPLLIAYAENPLDPTNTVYGYVPAHVVWEVILRHGGIVDGELPQLTMT